MRPFNGQREVLRRLQERNEARARVIDGIRGIGGLEPIQVTPPTLPVNHVVDLGPVPRQRHTNFTMQYMGAPMRVDIPTYHQDYDGDYLTQMIARVREHPPVVFGDDLLHDLQEDNTRRPNGGGVGVNLQGLRDTETFRVQERFGMGVMGQGQAFAGRQTNRHGQVYHTGTAIRGVRGTTARHIQFSEPNWGELFGYNSNDNAKGLLKKDWNGQGEFLEEEKPSAIGSLWNHGAF